MFITNISKQTNKQTNKQINEFLACEVARYAELDWGQTRGFSPE